MLALHNSPQHWNHQHCGHHVFDQNCWDLPGEMFENGTTATTTTTTTTQKRDGRLTKIIQLKCKQSTNIMKKVRQLFFLKTIYLFQIPGWLPLGMDTKNCYHKKVIWVTLFNNSINNNLESAFQGAKHRYVNIFKHQDMSNLTFLLRRSQKNIISTLPKRTQKTLNGVDISFLPTMGKKQTETSQTSHVFIGK